MNKFIKSILFLALISFASCEDVIDVEVPNAATRLIIEASLDWQKGTSGNNQTIKLSTSTPYFDTTINTAVLGASVKVTNTDSGAEYVFADQNDGNYSISNFVPVIDNTYDLEVIYNNEVYTASETMTSVSEINRAEQSLEGGFDDDILDVSFFWDDPEDEENFYIIKFIENDALFLDFEWRTDEFTNGNEMEEFFERYNDEDEDDENSGEFMSGDIVSFSLYGVSERYYNYMDLLLDLYYAGGDPFGSTPAEIKGNCINTVNPDNYAFGFFKLSEFDTLVYTFE